MAPDEGFIWSRRIASSRSFSQKALGTYYIVTTYSYTAIDVDTDADVDRDI